MTIHDALQQTIKQLADVAGDFAVPESEQIFEHLLRCSRSEIYLLSRDDLPQKCEVELSRIVSRRLTSEPLPYILGSMYFYNREFIVTNDVLIPRPDTEILVDTILTKESKPNLRFADIGTGSGIITAVLSESNPNWFGIAVDISWNALQIAKKNFTTPVNCIQGDILYSFKNICLDFVASNPPYLTKQEMGEIDKSVKDFEPNTALYGGVDGLDFYRAIANESLRCLKQGGRLYCEIGYSQAEPVTKIFENSAFGSIRIIKDLGNRDRVITCQKQGPSA